MGEEDAETTDTNHNAPAKKCSERYQDLRSNEKISPPCQKRSMRLMQEKDQHVDISSTGRQRKPWPSRRVTGLEEVVKNTASVPSYLQCLEKGDSVQEKEKALNFGVLDWGSLDKWTYLQKQMAHRRGVNSPSGSNASSSPFSTVGSSSWSTRSNDSPLARRNYPDEARRTALTKEQCSMTQHSLHEQCPMIEGMRDHRQEGVHKGRMSCDFAVASRGRSAEVNRSSFSSSFPVDGIPIPRSCPLPSTAQSGEPVVDSSPVSGNEKSTPDTKGKHGKHDILTDRSSGRSLRRELSPHRLLRAGISRIRSSILREWEGSSGHQTKQTCSSAHEDEQAATARGRRSPLRRMLDPLLKTNSRSQFSGPIASSPSRRRGQDTSNSNKLPIRDLVTESASPVQDEKRGRSTRQAMLKFAWKNGLPLFMLSSSDGDIFAATVGKRNVSEKNASECVYTLFRAEEIKGSNVKKQGLVYNVVGQMKVSPAMSTAEDPESCYREFVLFGAQLVPAGQPVNSVLNGELAAIVVKVPSRSSDSSNLSLSSIVAILPSAVHGSSTVGEPSPLMKRWRSGGSCDCGGWDEGCMLTVLTDRARGSISASAQSCVSDGTRRRIELFNQGGDGRAKEHAFAMVAINEGVYTVEFGPSMAVLQAFAICVATLHCRRPTSLARLR